MLNSSIFGFWPEVHRQYGDFYSIGIFGLGAGATGDCYVIQDPVEMAKIVRREGQHPAGAAEFTWPIITYCKEHDQSIGHLLGRGAAWKRIRSFVQTDLLHPVSAARYSPAVLQAAASASRGAPAYAESLNEYLNVTSFEMFSAVMMGQLPGIPNPDTETADEDVQFCDSVAAALRWNSHLMVSGYHAILTTQLGYKTAKYKEFEREWHTAQTIAAAKVEDLYQRRAAGQLTETEKSCYAVHAFERHEQDEETSLTLEETKTLVGGLLAAGVDTTGGMLSWKLLHIALSEITQELIHAELTASMKKLGTNRLIPESITPKQAPYLHAALRESHRLANPVPMSPMKSLPDVVQVHGVTLPAGSVVMLDGYTTGIRPDMVGDEALEFDPTRFLPEAVAARKGTERAVLDHPFFAGPFSQGARKCPGSRVANMEAAAVLAQLVLDWKITVPGVQHWTEVPYDQQTVITATLPRMEFTPREAVRSAP